MLKLFTLKVDVTGTARNDEGSLNTVIQVYAYNNTKSVSANKSSVILGTCISECISLFVLLSWIKPFGTSSVHASDPVRAAKTAG
jgi:hypothetical protein